MKERVIPPHLITPEDEVSDEKKEYAEKNTYGRQGPSKYGKGGRRAYVAKRKKKQ